MPVQTQTQIQTQTQTQIQPQAQKQVTTQAIASTPSPTTTDNIPAIINNPTVGIILAFAVLVRAILGSPSAN